MFSQDCLLTKGSHNKAWVAIWQKDHQNHLSSNFVKPRSIIIAKKIKIDLKTNPKPHNQAIYEKQDETHKYMPQQTFAYSNPQQILTIL